MRLAGVSGFEILSQPEGRWPKARHKDTDVKVDVLPEGASPGTSAKGKHLPKFVIRWRWAVKPLRRRTRACPLWSN